MSNPTDYRNPASSITLQRGTQEPRDYGGGIGGEMNRMADKKHRGQNGAQRGAKRSKKRTKMERIQKDKS